ncbi:MAG: adenosylcobinamide-GDP ribazoletransferase [Blautia sp.]|nr:adenosylcobinamide-GDP ribazoletransferase [Blautia sp.]
MKKTGNVLPALWNSFKAAFAMFSRIPMPKTDWSEDHIGFLFCFFPWVGLAIGGLSMLVRQIGIRRGYHENFICAVLVILPVVLTGGIHLDGLLDTTDALYSYQEKSRRIEILKDSHAGAFAVIRAGMYYLLQFGAFCQIWKNTKAMLMMSGVYVLSRCLSGWGVLTIPKVNSSGTAALFAENAKERQTKIVLGIYVITLTLLMPALSPVMGWAVIVCAGTVFIWYRQKAVKYFGGTNGDLSGYFLCSCEQAAALVLAVLTVVTG